MTRIVVMIEGGLGNLFAVDHETRKPLMAYALSFAMKNG